MALSASMSVIVPAYNKGPAVGRLGLVSEQISTLRFRGRFEETGRPEEPRA